MGFTKNQYIGGLGQFADLTVGLGKKEVGGVFEGRVDTPMDTMNRTWTHNCLVCKQTLDHLGKLASLAK